jgi:4-hydroxythreonine-4-phosphate dehydrogenase
MLRIGVTLGDPTGIGPELVLDAATGDDLVIYGDRRLLTEAGTKLERALPARIQEVTRLTWAPGRPSEESGRAQVAYLEAAVADARVGKLDALVTAPIHKASCLAAGFAFPGHTEFLAARLGVEKVTMMLAGPKLRVSLATIHCGLAEVPSLLTVDGTATAIRHTADALRRSFGFPRPRIAVAGLNPHAGEQGHFGDEEARLIAPAIARARGEAGECELAGPLVPDAVFRQHLDGRWDAVVAMYHDQGLIPVKLVDFDEAVNVTLGLPPLAGGRPFVRTSPDHGVAHDIAGTGRARSTSFAAALKMARRMCQGGNP